MNNHASDLKEMLDVNKKLAEFYNSISREDDVQEQAGYAKHGEANLLTRAWAAMR